MELYDLAADIGEKNDIAGQACRISWHASRRC